MALPFGFQKRALFSGIARKLGGGGWGEHELSVYYPNAWDIELILPEFPSQPGSSVNAWRVLTGHLLCAHLCGKD
jgi:hypothetical protein